MPFRSYEPSFGGAQAQYNFTHMMTNPLSKKPESVPDLTQASPPRLEDALVVDRQTITAYFTRVRHFVLRVMLYNGSLFWATTFPFSSFPPLGFLCVPAPGALDELRCHAILLQVFTRPVDPVIVRRAWVERDAARSLRLGPRAAVRLTVVSSCLQTSDLVYTDVACARFRSSAQPRGSMWPQKRRRMSSAELGVLFPPQSRTSLCLCVLSPATDPLLLLKPPQASQCEQELLQLQREKVSWLVRHPKDCEPKLAARWTLGRWVRLQVQSL